MRAPEEIPYSWDLVFRVRFQHWRIPRTIILKTNIKVSTRKELKTLCEVCKLFNDLATPLMYRSVILSKSHITGENWDVLPSEVDDPAKAKDLSCSLFYRLLHDEKIRAQTRDLTLAEIEDRADMALVRQKLKHPDDPLTSLVKQMPNLGNV